MAGRATPEHVVSAIGLAPRVLALIALFGIEAFTATVLLDGKAPVPAGAWLTLIVHRQGALLARCSIAFAALFGTFAYLRYGAQVAKLAEWARGQRFRPLYLAGHALAMAAFALLSKIVYGGQIPAAVSNLSAAAWLIAAAAAVAFAALAVLPWEFWTELAASTGRLWAYAGTGAIAAGSLYPMWRMLWQPTTRITFAMVQVLARPFFGQLIIRPDQMLIGTARFRVIVAEECSGLEGIGLMLMFGVVWLILFRDEIRVGRALVLLPLGVVTLFFLNSVRILGLLAIGSAGARDIARGGFHSQAGWLAFNSVAFGLCVAARNLRWIAAHPKEKAAATAAHDDGTTAMLVPFLAILAAGMLSRAMSGAFEWWYALRFVAAGAALLVFRRRYAAMEWRPGWAAAVWGVLVFALWLGMDRMPGGAPQAAMPKALAAASPAARWAWIALRVLGAAITTPLAEELAFRSYLLRRLISEDFESVPARSFTWTALAGSSVAFGLMHGGRWVSGTAAGLVYGVAMISRGRIGDAVAAHAVTNLLLAVYVLGFRQWQFW